MREIKLLEHGLFEKKFMDSRANTDTVSKKELILGHLIGPLGLIFVVNTIAALGGEVFYTADRRHVRNGERRDDSGDGIPL